jgi:hypothetical protein
LQVVYYRDQKAGQKSNPPEPQTVFWSYHLRRLSTFLLIVLNLLTREPLIGSVRISLGRRKKRNRRG